MPSSGSCLSGTVPSFLLHSKYIHILKLNHHFPTFLLEYLNQSLTLIQSCPKLFIHSYLDPKDLATVFQVHKSIYISFAPV
jgi:hypothetical protein